MVSGKLLYQIYQRINEILIPLQDMPFSGKSQLVCRDLHQFLPIQAKPVFMFKETETTEGFMMLDLRLKF